MRIALVAACDRYNFGDVLLPKIFEFYYREQNENDTNTQFDYYSLTSASLLDIGGNDVKSFSHIKEGTSAIIFVGGEILSANYISMHLYLNPNRLVAFVEHVFRKIPFTKSVANRICGRVYFNNKSELPWLYYSEQYKVYYNAVGGTEFYKLNNRLKKEWRKAIDSSMFFSVRDKKTYQALINEGNDRCRLIPDTAIIMDELSVQVDKNVRQDYIQIKENFDYYVVQVNQKIGSEILNEIIQAINLINKNLNLVCVLLVIGHASGHNDRIPLYKIKCKTSNSIFIEDANIYETIYLIRNAMCYIGSSLHGAITAMAYYVPHTALTKKSKKLINYLETWNTTKILTINTVEEFYGFAEMCSEGNDLVNKVRINQMKEIVKDYFDEIISDL